jgi:hypothetical protein
MLGSSKTSEDFQYQNKRQNQKWAEDYKSVKQSNKNLLVCDIDIKDNIGHYNYIQTGTGL